MTRKLTARQQDTIIALVQGAILRRDWSAISGGYLYYIDGKLQNAQFYRTWEWLKRWGFIQPGRLGNNWELTIMGRALAGRALVTSGEQEATPHASE